MYRYRIALRMLSYDVLFLQPMTILQQQLKIDGSTEFDSYVNNLSEEMSCLVYLLLQLEGFLSMI